MPRARSAIKRTKNLRGHTKWPLLAPPRSDASTAAHKPRRCRGGAADAAAAAGPGCPTSKEKWDAAVPRRAPNKDKQRTEYRDTAVPQGGETSPAENRNEGKTAPRAGFSSSQEARKPKAGCSSSPTSAKQTRQRAEKKGDTAVPQGGETTPAKSRNAKSGMQQFPRSENAQSGMQQFPDECKENKQERSSAQITENNAHENLPRWGPPTRRKTSPDPLKNGRGPRILPKVRG